MSTEFEAVNAALLTIEEDLVDSLVVRYLCYIQDGWINESTVNILYTNIIGNGEVIITAETFLNTSDATFKVLFRLSKPMLESLILWLRQNTEINDTKPNHGIEIDGLPLCYRAGLYPEGSS